MTCNVVVRYQFDNNVRVVCGTDSEVSSSSTRFVGAICSKMQRLGDSFILLSGAGPILEAVELLLEDKDYCDSIRLNTRSAVREVAEVIFSLLKDLIGVSVAQPSSADQVGTLLFASPEHIWAVYGDMSILEFEHFQTSGAGEDVALGALEIMYSENEYRSDPVSWEELELMVNKAISAANKHVLGCGEPIVIQRVLPLEDPPAKKDKKKRKKQLKLTLE